MASKINLLVLRWLHDRRHYSALVSLEEELGQVLHTSSDEISTIKSLCMDGDFDSLQKLVSESFKDDNKTILIRCIHTESLLEELIHIGSKEHVIAFLDHLRAVRHILDPQVVHDIEESVQMTNPASHSLFTGWTVRGGRYRMFLTMLPIFEQIFGHEGKDRGDMNIRGNPLDEIVTDFASKSPDEFNRFFELTPAISKPLPPQIPTSLSPRASVPQIISKYVDNSSHPIRTCTFSNTGSQVAIGTNSQSLVVCGASDMKVLGRADRVHSGSVYSCAWGPDDALIATGSNDQVIKLTSACGLVGGGSVGGHRIHLQSGTVRSLVFQADNVIVAGCSGDSIVRGVDISGEVIWRFDCLEGFINSLGVDRNQREIVAAATSTGAVSVIDPRSKDPAWELGVTDACTACIAIHGNSIVVGNEKGNVLSWDIRYTQVPLWVCEKAHSGSCRSVAFNRTGGMIATASFDGTSLLIEGKSGKIINTLTGHNDKVVHVEWSPVHGNRLVTCGTDSTVLMWSKD